MTGYLSHDFSVDSNKGLAMFYMVVSSVVISFGGLIMRSLETSDPLQISFYRSLSLLGAVIVFLLMQYGRQSIQVIRNIGWIGIAGGCLLGGAGLAHLQALATTTIANAMFVLGAIPFFTALFARILLKEKLRKRTLATMLIAATGLGVMVQEGLQLGAGYGNVMAILTAVCFSVYAVIIRSRRRIEMLPVLIVSSLVIVVSSALGTKGALSISFHDVLLCLIWGAVLSGIANFLFLYAARHLVAAEVTLFMLLEFALGPIWVWWVVNETPSLWTVVGGALIMGAVVVRSAIELINKPQKSILSTESAGLLPDQIRSDATIAVAARVSCRSPHKRV